MQPSGKIPANRQGKLRINKNIWTAIRTKCPIHLPLPEFCNHYWIMTTSNLSEQEIIRREKLAGLQQLGVDPYPAALFPVSHYSADILKRYT